MQTKNITADMRLKLREPLPKEAVKQHPTKTYLSSIKAIFVTERLNDVFGVGGWQTRVEHIITTEKSMVVVKVIFTIPEYSVYYECFGGNDNGGEGSKNFDLGDAFKGAVTDALTKIGSYLEIGIDIYKGASTAPPGGAAGKNNTPPDGEKPWLNKTTKDGSITKEWDAVVAGLRNGYKLEQVKLKYKLSKSIEGELIKIINP
jgi:hypothetical protein